MSPGLYISQPVQVPISGLVVGSGLDQTPLFAPLRAEPFTLTCVPGLSAALTALSQNSFQFICCSADFRPLRLLELFEAFKHASTDRLIPLILVVDLNQHLVSFPTSHWGGRFGLVHSQTSPAEWQALLDRLLT